MKGNNPQTELEKALQDAGFTKAEFAEKIGVCYNTVMKWASGKEMPRDDNAKKIKEALGFFLGRQKMEERRLKGP